MNNFPKATWHLNTWLCYIENLHPEHINFQLDRIKYIATLLDLLKPFALVFTVAGTNGKGTTCKIIETILIAAGYRVGVYSSPHLLRYTERVRIQGKELLESEHIHSFNIIENKRGTIPLTYFEYSTLSALWLFKQSELDVIVLEVGLGGRLDATNIVNTDVAIITNIALDHTEWLGYDRESIAREKAGIFRRGKLAVIGEYDIPHSIYDVADKTGAILLEYGHDWSYTKDAISWSFKDAFGEINNLILPEIPLPNAAIALAALRGAGGLLIDEQIIRDTLPFIRLPGRFQTILNKPRVILDVAHNPHAAAYLAKRISSLSNKGKLYAIVGMLHDKDIRATLDCLTSKVDYWYCVSLFGPRGTSAERFLDHLNSNNVRIFISPKAAYQKALSQAKEQDIILVFGSFYTVAQIMIIFSNL